MRFVENILIESARIAKATVVNSSFHRFGNGGVSGCVIVAESHICIHTWPEYNFMTVDVYTCGDHTHPEKAIDFIKEMFGGEIQDIKTLERGII